VGGKNLLEIIGDSILAFEKIMARLDLVLGLSF
jgi:hypothetical protein